MTKQNQQLLLVGACGLLIISAFMPWLGSRSESLSALEIVFSSSNQMMEISFLAQLGLLLIPVAAGVILFYHFKKAGAYPISKQILFVLPLAGVVVFFFFVRSLIKQFSGGLFGKGPSFTELVGSGFWIALLAALGLAFLVYGLKYIDKGATTPTSQPTPAPVATSPAATTPTTATTPASPDPVVSSPTPPPVEPMS